MDMQEITKEEFLDKAALVVLNALIKKEGLNFAPRRQMASLSYDMAEELFAEKIRRL